MTNPYGTYYTIKDGMAHLASPDPYYTWCGMYINAPADFHQYPAREDCPKGECKDCYEERANRDL